MLVVGESLVDIVRTASGHLHEYAGGSAANVAVALARLGRPTRLASSFADDHHGAMVADHLERAGVTLACDPGAVDHTSTALATIGTAGAADYVFDIDWRLSPVPDDEDPLVTHVCSLGPVLLPGADDVLALLRRLRDRSTVSYDVNARPVVTGTGPEVVARVERTVAVADLVKASDEDLEALYPHQPHAESAAALLELGPAVVVVTRGADGALWLDRAGRGGGHVAAGGGGRHDRCRGHLRGGPDRCALGARTARGRGSRGAGRAAARRGRRGARARRAGRGGHGLPPRRGPAVPPRARRWLSGCPSRASAGRRSCRGGRRR